MPVINFYECIESVITNADDSDTICLCRIKYDHIHMSEWDYNLEHQCSEVSCQPKEHGVKYSLMKIDILGHKISAIVDCGAEASLCSMQVW